MRLPVLGCFAFGYGVAVTILTGCGSPGVPGTPQLANAAPNQRAVLERIARRSWVAREAKSSALLYVTDTKSNDVLLYSYPAAKHVGTLSGFGSPRSECVDAAGDVWIADTGGDDVIEFPHGSKQPLYALDTPGAPLGCSVDPVNGNLAVSGGVDGVLVSVFRRTQHGWGSPVRYEYSGMATGAYCGYDAAGDLFVDGVDAQGAFTMAELRPGVKRLAGLKIDQTLKAPGQIQWDGSALAIEDAGVTPSVVYQFSVGTGALTKTGSTTLLHSKSIRQFWIGGSTLIGPDPLRDQIGFWNYPNGGSPATTISAVHAYGAVVSPAQ